MALHMNIIVNIHELAGPTMSNLRKLYCCLLKSYRKSN